MNQNYNNLGLCTDTGFKKGLVSDVGSPPGWQTKKSFKPSFGWLFALLFFVSLGGFAQTVTIGTGTTTGRAPLTYYFGFSRNASIYTATEMGTTSTGFVVNTIGYYTNTAANSGPTVVYMRLVGSTTAETAATWATKISGATTVYSGTPAVGSAGAYRTITLSAPFTVTAGQNLEIMVECNQTGTGTGGSGANAIRYSTVTGASMNYEADNAAPTGNGTVSGNRPNLQIGYSALVACTGTPTPGNTLANGSATPYSGCAGSSVSLSIQTSTPGSGVTFDWQSSTSLGGPYTSTGATGASYSPIATTTPTYYQAAVTCSGNTGTTTPVLVSGIVCTFDVTKSPTTFTSISATGSSMTGWRNGTTNTDDNMSTSQSIGFAFPYKGQTYSNFSASTNGFLTFNVGTTALGNTTAPYNFDNSTLSSSSILTLAPFYEDLVTQGNPSNIAGLNSAIKYKLDGVSPNQVATIEWIGFEGFQNAGPNLNFQVKLYENGTIEFVYGTMELFNGSANYGYSYTLGLNGATVSGTPALYELQTQQVENVQNFSNTANNILARFMDCNTKYTFTSGTYSGAAAAPTLTNDEAATAINLNVNTLPATAFCGTNYTSKNATASAGIPVCSAATPGTPDDDVWFKFTATTDKQTVTVRGAGGYNSAVQLFSDAGITPLFCVNATGAGLTETLNGTGLTPGNVYYVRVYNTVTGATSNPTAGATTAAAGAPDFSIYVNEVVTPPANDDIAGAITLTTAATCSNTAGTTLNATASSQAACSGTPDDDVWYKFTALTTADLVTVQSNGTFNAHVQLFSSSDNTAAGTLTTLACVNNTSTGGVETASATLVAGNVYFIRVYHTLAGTASGSFTICVTGVTPSCVANPTSPTNGGVACLTNAGLSWPAAPGATSYDVVIDGGAPVNVTTNSYNAGALSAGAHTWSVTPKNPIGAATGCSTWTFSLEAAPVVGTASGPSALLTGEAGSFSENGTGGTLQWQIATVSGGPYTNITGATTSPISIFFSVAGTYYLQLVRTVPGCTTTSNQLTVTVTVAPGDECNNPIVLAPNTTVTTGNLATGGNNISFSSFPASGCQFSTPGNERYYSFTSTVAGTYTLEVTNVNGGTSYNDYLFQPITGDCASTAGWTCIDDNNGVGTDTFDLAASTTYWILVDSESNLGTANHTFRILTPITCGVPTAVAVTDIKPTTVDIAWAAPTVGTGATYDWEIRTSGAGGSGASGLTTSGSTTAPTVSVNDVPGLSAATSYTLYVRSNCSGGAGSSIWSNGTSFTTTPTCGVPTAITLSDLTLTTFDVSWTASTTGTAATYDWEVRTSGAAGSGATGLTTSGNTAATSLNDITVATATTYNFYVRTNCTGADGSSSWSAATPLSLTEGESCTTAQTITVATSLATATNTLLTTGITSDGPNGTCSSTAGNISKKDRFVKFVAPASGNRVIISTTAGTLTDAVMQVFDSCPATGANALGCNDDVDTAGGLFMPELTFCSLTPGATYYVQVFPFGASTTGNFNIKIYEDAVACPPPPANDNCAGAVTLTVGADGTCATNQASGTTVNATSSPGVVKTTCDQFGIYHDVFYKFNSGNHTSLNINFTNVNGLSSIGIYSACGTVYEGLCNEGSFDELIEGFVANTEYTLVIWSNVGDEGDFTICVTAPPIINSTDPTSLTSNAEDDTLCGSGNSTTLTINGGSLGTGATWKFYSGGCGTENGGTLLTSSATNTYVVSPSVTTTYYARAEGEGNTTLCASVTITVGTLSTYYFDNDGDGFGSTIPADIQTSCEDLTALGYVTNGNDCDDSDPAIHAPLTPTVLLTSDDADNTFCAGTSVTFTAAASNLSGLNDGDYYLTGPVQVVYAFKVGATTVQTGASNTYTTSALTNGQSVSVSISVTGGTCRTSDTANSNSISNTVNGVAEICWNGILENCSTVLSQGCAPVVVNMTPSYNGFTLTSLSQAIPAVPYAYGGFTNLKYRFTITNVNTGQVATDIIQTSRFVVIPTTIRSYNTSYTIKASAVINEEIVPYAGNTITVNAPTVTLITLGTSSCGATLATLASTLTANPGLNATGYTFRIRTNDLNPSPTYYESQSATRFVSANTFAGFPLQYGSSYKVSVQFTFNDPLTNLPVQSGYGAECTVNTPTIPVTTIASPTCNGTVTSLAANMSATAAPYATGYRFRIRLFADNGPTPTYFYTLPNASRFSTLSAFQGITLSYSTAYSISVEYSILNGSSTVWSGFGAECKVTTPFFPTTSLVPSQCGQVAATSLTQQLNITPYPGFPNYKVRLEEVNGEEVGASQEITTTYSYFRLNQFSIAQLGKNYQVSVAIKLNGVFGDFNSPPCDLHTPAVGKANTTVAFAAVAYPNPFANNFMIDVKTESQSNVNIKVYDMIGRMIEQRDVRVSDMESTTIGNNYPSGVYNVVVSQEDSVQTVRVVKR